MNGSKRFLGIVQAGAKRGAALGFPTANIVLSDSDVSGIYAAHAEFDGHVYQAAVYADQQRMLLEAHLLDFSGDLYGKAISIELVEKLRESARFQSEVALKAAIADDIVRVRDYFNNQK
jgi:riboflavin kinase / FMN adenylyltransferase